MPESRADSAVAELASLGDLAQTLENMKQALSEALADAASDKMELTLATCVKGLADVSGTLRDYSELHDPGGAREFATGTREFRSLAADISSSIGDLTETNHQFANRLGEQVTQLDELAALPPGDDVAARVRSAVAHVREIAGDIQQNLGTISTKVDSANADLSVLQQELEEAKEKAAYDALTRLHSRAALNDHLDEAIRRGAPDGPWSLLLIDIDHFKRVNDTHGHVVGDALLYSVARTLERSLRTKRHGDFLARYGGDEFAVVLAHASAADAGVVADRIRQSVAATRWQQRSNNDATVLQTTVSIGLGEYREGDTATDLIERADRALYKAKGEGRNRVVAAESYVERHDSRPMP